MKHMQWSSRRSDLFDACDRRLRWGSEEYWENPVTVGPWGRELEADWDDGYFGAIRKIVVSHGSVIHSIEVEYDADGLSVRGDTHGQRGGNIIDTIHFGYPSEVLISLSGFVNGDYISSLTFETSMGRYGPYGKKEGLSFSLPTIGGKVVGFFGKAGAYLNSIGVHFTPLKGLEEYGGNPVKVGPWGTLRGEAWDDGHFGAIKQIVVGYGAALDSIQIDYDADGTSVQGERHGTTAKFTETINFTFPKEVLISVSGYLHPVSGYSHPCIQSLTFETNMGNYGPFGEEKGMPFSLPSMGGKIVGFYGGWFKTGGTGLAYIGVYYRPPKIIKRQPKATNKGLVKYWDSPVKVGQWGGHTGNAWDDGHFGAIRQIVVGHGAHIASIQFEYDVRGRVVPGRKHGSDTNKYDKISFRYPDEVLISISGYVGEKFSFTNIRSLTFETNVRKYGPFGEEEGVYFSLPAIGGKVVGFYGRIHSTYGNLVSIGVHYKPLKISKMQYPLELLNKKYPLESLATSLKGLATETCDKEVDVTVNVRFGLN